MSSNKSLVIVQEMWMLLRPRCSNQQCELQLLLLWNWRIFNNALICSLSANNKTIKHLCFNNKLIISGFDIFIQMTYIFIVDIMNKVFF